MLQATATATVPKTCCGGTRSPATGQSVSWSSSLAPATVRRTFWADGVLGASEVLPGVVLGTLGFGVLELFAGYARWQTAIDSTAATTEGSLI